MDELFAYIFVYDEFCKTPAVSEEVVAMEDAVHAEEEQYLNRCLSLIDELITKDKQWLHMEKPRGSGNKFVDREVRRLREDEVRDLEAVRPKPYFGRVDFAADDSPNESQPYYFGTFRVPENPSPQHPVPYVIGFGARVCDLYYRPLGGGYDAPAGRITGTVTLKRQIVIDQAHLVDIIDYELPQKGKPAPAEEAILTEELSKPKGDSLRDIIPTIKPEQYEGIAAAFQQVVIIQGVAGSGKSEVGLHRIVYLLSPHNELNLKISPEKVTFFGPSKPFIKYISNLLPDLRVPKIKQTTIHDWLRGTLSSRPRLERRDSFLEELCRGTKDNLEGRQRVARFKGSLHMARLLEKHVQTLRKGFIENTTSIVAGERVVVSKSEVVKIIRESQRGPLNEQRKQALYRLESRLREKSVMRSGEPLPAEIKTQFDKFWPELDYRELYLRLLSDRNALEMISKAFITEDDVELIRGSLSERAPVFKIEDLPVLCYLDHLLNERVSVRRKGRTVPLFEHVVIDEAQDVSPLEFLLVYRHSQNKSFTILGDIGQCVLPHRGITNWREVKEVFSRESIGTFKIPLSYRATYEITKYANRVLKSTKPAIARPVPYKRHGEEPTFLRSKSYAAMVVAIARDIRLLREQGMQTIAVLCKTSGEALKLQRRLINEGIRDAVVLGKPGYERTKISVSSIYDTKGLEYDAVILAKARRNNYTGSPLHNGLLYIAITRAVHKLHVHWFDTIADALVTPALLRETRKNRAAKKTKGTRSRRSH